eukprot:11230_1
MANTLLLILCGLPGAGKTSMCNFLKTRRRENFNVAHICFDDIYSEISKSESEFDPGLWKKCRRVAYERAEALLKAHRASSTDRHIIVMDDNFYFRSMRYPYFQLCRKYRVAFAQLLVEVSETDSQLRNTSRDTHARVPKSVIERMCARFEAPKPNENKWESCSAVFENQTCSESDADLRFQIPWDFIENCFSNGVPDQLPVVDLKEQVRSQEANLKSVVHQSDISFRKIVSQTMSSLKSENPEYNNLGGAASVLNELRRKCLRDVSTSGGLHLDSLEAVKISVELHSHHFRDLISHEMSQIVELSNCLM